MRRRLARLVSSAIAAAFMVSFAAVAGAYDTGSRSVGVFPSGYMSCREERQVDSRGSVSAIAGATVRGTELLVPLPSRRRVPLIVLGHDLADEVALVEPVPAGRRTPSSLLLPLPELPSVVRESSNNYLCLGLVRGRPGILRTIAAPAGARFYGHPHDASWRINNMVAASLFHLVETKGALRSALARPIADKNRFETTELRTAAAVALAELSDQESVPAIRAWTEELESKTLGFQFRSALYALEQLDPVEAERYATAMLERVADGELGQRVNADLLLPVTMLTPRLRGVVLPTLRRLTAAGSSIVFGGSNSRCVLTAARLRFGDSELVPMAREQMSGTLTDGLAVNCYSEWLVATIGDDPSDVDALLHRRAYEPMLRFVQHVRRNRAAPGGRRADWERAASKLLAGLEKGLSAPELGDRSRNDYHPTHRAMHLAAMAGLENPAARHLLYEMVEDPKDETDGAWVAAYWALRLRLPGAASHALRRLEMGIEKPAYLARLEFTVGVPTTWRTRVLEELVRVLPAGDASWTIALLDREESTRERAVHLLSRRKPAGACQVVLEAASNSASEVRDETIKQAFWALSILGDACWEPMSRAGANASLEPSVRGPAIVLLAMTRAPQARARVDAVGGLSDFRLYVQTANIILRSPE